MDSVHGSWTSAGVAGPQFHRELHSGWRQGLVGARPSSRARPRRLVVRRGKEGWRHGESNLANTEAWKGARGRLTGGGVSAQKGSGEGTVRAKRRSAGGVGVFTEGGGDAGEAGCLQWPALMELQCPRIEGTGYRGLKREKGAA
jgi:hypothetical protein